MVRRRSCRELETGLSLICAGGVHAPGEAHVDPRALTAALVTAAEPAGANVLSGTEVTGALLERGGLMGVETAAGAKYCAERVVVACGCWSRNTR